MPLNNKKGFTIIELIVVIAVIAVLSTVVLVAIQKHQVKATGARITQDFKSMEVALNLLKVEQKRSVWPLESAWDNHIRDIVGLNQFLSTSISPPVGTLYTYDNEGDTIIEGDCGCCFGVNIGLEGCYPNCKQFFDIVDSIIDNGNGPCYGRIRSNGVSYSYIYYNIAPVQTSN